MCMKSDEFIMIQNFNIRLTKPDVTISTLRTRYQDQSKNNPPLEWGLSCYTEVCSILTILFPPYCIAYQRFILII